METDLLKLDSLENAFQDMERLFRRNLDKLVELRTEAAQKPLDDECLVDTVEIKTPSEDSVVVSSPMETELERATESVSYSSLAETAHETATESPACSSLVETPVESVVEAYPTLPVALEEGKTPVTVYVRVAFLRIGQIELVNQRCQAEVLVQSRWIHPSPGGKRKEQHPQEVDWSGMWNPELYIDNVEPDAEVTVSRSLTHNPFGRTSVFERCRVSGWFRVNMSRGYGTFDETVRNFNLPLVQQTSHMSLPKPPSGALVVSVRSRRSVGELLLKREISETADMLPTTRVPEFNLYDNLVFHQGTTIDKVPPLDRRRKLPPAVSKPTSHPSYFLLNVFVALTGVCAMAFFGSLFKRSQMENRILGAVLMLTGFALKRLIDPVIHGKNDPAIIARTRDQEVAPRRGASNHCYSWTKGDQSHVRRKRFKQTRHTWDYGE